MRLKAVKDYEPYPEGSPWVGIAVGTMQYQRIGSWEFWREYQSRVIRQTEDALGQINPDILFQVAIPELAIIYGPRVHWPIGEHSKWISDSA
jgi:hypothetical protein